MHATASATSSGWSASIESATLRGESPLHGGGSLDLVGHVGIDHERAAADHRREFVKSVAAPCDKRDNRTVAGKPAGRRSPIPLLAPVTRPTVRCRAFSVCPGVLSPRWLHTWADLQFTPIGLFSAIAHGPDESAVTTYCLMVIQLLDLGLGDHLGAARRGSGSRSLRQIAVTGADQVRARKADARHRTRS
jgi:hypothetical protein